MPWKLIVFLCGMVILLIFTGFNYTNVSDISLGFHVFEDVPIFMGLLISFVAGALFAVPFALGSRSAKKKRGRIPSEPFMGEPLEEFPKDPSVPPATGRGFAKKRKERKVFQKEGKEAPPARDVPEEPVPEHLLDPKHTEH